MFPLLFLIYLPFFITKLTRRGNFKEGFWERFGFYSRSKKDQLTCAPRPVWIHAVSVGETVAALSLIRVWSKLQPELNFVLSTTTSTGQQIARDRSPQNVVPLYFPLDFYVCTWSALKTIRPRIFIIFEVEIWPNIIVSASRRDIPLALVNTRMSDKSARGYQRYRWLFKDIFNRFSLICTQTENDAHKIRFIAGNRSTIKVCNTMKFDQTTLISDSDADELINKIFAENGRIIFTAASTHPGEELLIAKVIKLLANEYTNLYHILVPRHVERSSEIEKILKGEGLGYVRLTDLRNSMSSGGRREFEFNAKVLQVLLVDTTGEMMNFLAVSDIVFVGNSMAGNKGGHNIIEPALLGKPIIFGQGMDNFRLVAQIFKNNSACIQVRDERTLAIAVRNLLDNHHERERLGRASLATVEKNKGAIGKTIEHLQKICP